MCIYNEKTVCGTIKNKHEVSTFRCWNLRTTKKPFSLQVYPVLVPKDGSHHIPISSAMTWVQVHSNVTDLRVSGAWLHPSFTSLNLSAQVQLTPPLLIHWIISFLVLVIHFLQPWPQICEIWRSLPLKVLPIFSSHSFLRLQYMPSRNVFFPHVSFTNYCLWYLSFF